MLGTDRSRPAWDDDPVVARWPGLPQLDTDVSDPEDGAIQGFAIADEDRKFYGVQFPPEFKSRPDAPSPLHLGLVRAALEHAA